jgi:hypothetical protein
LAAAWLLHSSFDNKIFKQPTSYERASSNLTSGSICQPLDGDERKYFDKIIV